MTTPLNINENKVEMFDLLMEMVKKHQHLTIRFSPDNPNTQSYPNGTLHIEVITKITGLVVSADCTNLELNSGIKRLKAKVDKVIL